MATAAQLNDNALEKHMIFLCPECGKHSTTQVEWRRHINNIHGYAHKTSSDFNFKEIDSNHHECQICLKWIPNGHQTPAVLQYHRFNHLPYPKIYRCKHCRGSFYRKRSLIDHLHRNHAALVNKGAIVQSSNSGNDIKNPLRDPCINKEFYIRFLCPLCGKLFERYHIWLLHLDSAHPSTSVDLKMNRITGTNNYYCSTCSFTLKDGPSRSQLQRHHFSHLPYPSYFQCAFCYSRKEYKTELLLHFMKYHTREFFKYKKYIVIPDEWGGCADRNTITEIQRLLGEAQPKSDILQKALLDINLEDEGNSDHASKFNHEMALDQSLNSGIVVPHNNRTPLSNNRSKTTTIQFSDISEQDLESICQEMFEEIPDSNGLLTDNFNLTKQMQKYIHYLCPECGNEFNDQITWRSHVYEAHNLINAVQAKFRPLNSLKTMYLCLVCHQILKTSKHADLRRHHFQHMPFQSYLKCIICSKTKSSKPKMVQHMDYVHLMHARRELNAEQMRKLAKKYPCLQCDKSYTTLARYRTHCRVCPKNLKPLPKVKCNIAENQRLLEHLKTASERLDNMLKEAGHQSIA
ncbi:zinc finger protein Xfin-like [Musca vetustissima]|uniref:zinc finger protein Xfin-like n=1 Tax=Musca vetustissima TaxID=27455 RepID=UPI002AB74DD6|nr:zinc finger protein Xfin-like [Musca vetustissima]